MPVSSTSTTLLRQLAADSQHVRWGEFVRRYQPMMEEYLRAHCPGIEVDDVVFYAPIYMMMFLEQKRLPERMIYDIGAPHRFSVNGRAWCYP